MNASLSEAQLGIGNWELGIKYSGLTPVDKVEAKPES